MFCILILCQLFYLSIQIILFGQIEVTVKARPNSISIPGIPPALRKNETSRSSKILPGKVSISAISDIEPTPKNAFPPLRDDRRKVKFY